MILQLRFSKLKNWVQCKKKGVLNRDNLINLFSYLVAVVICFALELSANCKL